MTINIYYEIDRLIHYGIQKDLITEDDKIYARNRLLDILGLDDYMENSNLEQALDCPKNILNNMLDWAYENKILKWNTPVYRELLDTKLMNCLMPRPSEVIHKFYEIYKDEGAKEATDYYYNLSKASNYIRLDRVKRDRKWKTFTPCGKLDITINLSKPEKDPKDIEKAKNMPASTYPQCLLCKENEGYAGRLNHPARNNHRIIPITLCDEKWYLQYSPYVYYNEHCIIFKNEHEPMKISKKTFDRILEFTEKFPHYFIGSNADLPIVGGSILSHDHFQGGEYELPMERAEVEKTFKIKGYEDIHVGIVKWPASVIRLRGKSPLKLSELACIVYEKWKKYSDESVDIRAYTEKTPHNTITPIGRRRGEDYELDLVLRNNRCDEKYPEGIFHPHRELHHIKKENIGLIEILGLAVLPSRLKNELEELSKYLIKSRIENEMIENEKLKKHFDWYLEMKDKYKNINEKNVDEMLKIEVGIIFSKVLEHAGVFKRNQKGQEAFIRFLDTI